MADFDKFLDMLATGVEEPNFSADELFQRQQDEGRVAPVRKGTGGVGMSYTMEDANAAIRNKQAANRVNENTDKYGVKAGYEADGTLSLTNVGVPRGTAYPTGPGGNGPDASGIAKNTPLAVGSLFDTLRKTTNVDEARGIAASLREAGAIEAAKFEMQAQTFAQNKVRLPELESTLNAAIAADKADPLYNPGMGDSPITAKIRTDVDQARAFADSEAKRFLGTNSGYAVLKSTLVSAESEIQRITRLGDRKDTLNDNLDYAAALRRQGKEDQLTDAAQGLDGLQRQRLLMLNPELMNTSADKVDANMMRTIEAKKGDKAWVATFQAAEEQLPILAIQGNPYAKSLIVAKEEQNAGVSPEVTQARLDNLNKLVSSPNFLKKALEQVSRGAPDAKKLVGDQIVAFNSKELTPEGKAANVNMKMQLALQLTKQNVSDRFENDAGSWKIADPLFTAAVKQARQVTNGAGMMDVLTAYVGDASGPTAVAKTQAFALLMESEALKSKDSVFGAPNYLQLKGKIYKTAIQKGPIAQWIADNQRQAGINAGPGIKALTDIGNLAGSIGGLFNSKPAIDPDTGLAIDN